MTTLGNRLMRAATVSLLLLTMATLAQAQDLQQRQRQPMQRQTASFGVSGVYSGIVGGQVVIDGTSYRLMDSATVYAIGTGMLPFESIAIGSHVYAMGSNSKGVPTIGLMVARNSDEPTTDGSDPSSHIRERDPSSPQ